MRTYKFLVLFWGVIPLLAQAGLLSENLLPNPTLEADSNGDGIPDFWNKGGSNPAMYFWTDTIFKSPTHALELNDTNTTEYAEWYSDRLTVQGGQQYVLRYNLRYVEAGAMRVSAGFFDSFGNFLPGFSYMFSGTQSNWFEFTQCFLAPTNATQLYLTFTSGGGMDVMGTAWLDDVSLAQITSTNSELPYIESFPQLPDPFSIRDWKQTALAYHQLAFNTNVTGEKLPLLFEYVANTSGGYHGPAFGLPSYVGSAPTSGEALTGLGAVLGGTLAGLDMSTLNGKDRVQQCEVFFVSVNGHGLLFNNIDSQGSGSAWYDIFPSMQFYQIGSYYPGRPSFETKMRSIAESWLLALPFLSNNWEHTGFDFRTMSPVDKDWHEPDMAIGIAWLEYMAFVKFGDPRYLAAAEMCLEQMNARSANPHYEVLGYYGPLLSARMNAEWGRNYSTTKFLDWVFCAGSDARPGWGCMQARWGNYDAYGLMGSTTDTSGYAFSMNTYTAAGVLAPVVRYESQCGRSIGRWLLHVAANANLFFPDTLPTNMQSSAAWSQQTGVTYISYEGVRNMGATTPYATGDATEPIQNFNPYGAWGSGWLAALFQTSNVPGILQIDCLKTEAYAPSAYPTYLFYNPYATTQRVDLAVGPNAQNLYDTVTHRYLATNIVGTGSFDLPPDAARVLVLTPANGILKTRGTRLMVDDVIVDYQLCSNECPEPDILQQPQSQTVCVESTVILTSGATGAIPLNSQWWKDGSCLTGATNATLTLTNIQQWQAGNYSLVVSNPYGTTTSTVAVLTIHSGPSVTTQPTNQECQTGGTISFLVAAEGTDSLIFSWRKDGEMLSGESNSVLTLTNVQSNLAGAYSVVVSDSCGSVTSSVALLKVLAPTTNGLLLGNMWPNSTMENDSNCDGTPDFWHQGGTLASGDEWTTNQFVSAFHCLHVIDNSTNTFSEWYSDKLTVTSGGVYNLRFWWQYQVNGTFRVSVNFVSALNKIVASQHFFCSDNHLQWEMAESEILVPTNAVKLQLTVTTGGPSKDTGELWVDDISLAPAPPRLSLTLSPSPILTVEAELGKTMVVERSADLLQWTEVMTFTPLSIPFAVPLTNSPSWEQQFFRIRSQ